jgi:ribose 5-phosphate isomerase B
MRISIASDHAGFSVKQILVAHLNATGHEVVDFGTDSGMPVDYADFIRPGAEAVATGKTDLGVVLGGSGNGEAIVANKIKGIRCAVCWNEESARLAREHNDANMIAIGERMIDTKDAIRIVDAWLNARFAGGRHQRRIDKIE